MLRKRDPATMPGIALAQPARYDDMNPRRRVRGPGLQDVVGRVPSRGDTFGVMYNEAPFAESSARGRSVLT